jgi:hypothetical protein
MTALAVAVRLIVAALLGATHPVATTPPVVTPIGRGAMFELPTGARADRGEAIGRLRCGAAVGRWADAHLEVFARGRVLIVPPGVGIARPRRRAGAAVHGGRCSYPVRTTDPTGVVRFRPGHGLRLGDVFAVWGQPVTRTRLCGFRSRAGVRLYVDGRRVAGPAAALVLRPHAEIVIEIGRFVPPHATYVFAGGRAATA